jgi:transcriptional regulator with XRE-family HTH domain
MVGPRRYNSNMQTDATHSLVAKLIRARREMVGLNQEDLAERLGVARNTINRWERGHNPPTAPMRRKLARALGGIPADYEWGKPDHEEHDRRIQIELQIRRLRRQLEDDSGA